MRDMSVDSTYLFVKDTVQTFIENVIIESVQNATRRWHTPMRRFDRPLITKDRPREHIPYFSGADYRVLRDPEDGLFKYWYMDLDQSGRRMGTGSRSKTCYAESQDGIEWTKPELRGDPPAHQPGNETGDQREVRARRLRLRRGRGPRRSCRRLVPEGGLRPVHR